MTTTSDTLDAPRAATRSQSLGRSWLRLLLMFSVPLAMVLGGGWYWMIGGRFVSTDNAYLRRDIVALAPEVSGHILDVAVHENQPVKAGQVLFRMDPEPYRIALAENEAALASARLQVEQRRAAYAQAQADLRASQQDLDFRQREYERQASLSRNGYAAQSAMDQAQNALRTAQAAAAKAQQGVVSALASLAGNPDIATDRHPLVQEALAKRDKAKLDLERTTIVAPTDGIVSQTAKLNPGQFMAAGSTAVDMVRSDTTYLEANFKETDLTHMTPGQEATVTLDVYPDVELHGRVESVGAGTGSEFSLLPVQNATGNWVKVVQRVPVRIRLADVPAGFELHTGLSANAEVDTQFTRSLPTPLRSVLAAVGLTVPTATAATTH